MKVLKRFFNIQFIILIGLTLCLLVLAVLYYSQQKRQFETEISKQLWAISEMKILQINDWRKERLADAYFISHDKDLIGQIKSLASNPSNPYMQNQIKEWMDVLFQNNQYAAMAVLSKENQILLGTENVASLVDSTVYYLSSQTELHRNTVFSDVYQKKYGKTLIYLAIPIFENENPNFPSIATVFLVINPYAYLFPMIQNWPYATKTAECILLKNVNGNLQNLSRLRFKPSKKHEFSFNDRETIVRNFFEKKKQGLDIKGFDYRNQKVYREITMVPGFDWYLVCKVDASEIMNDFNLQAFLKILATFLLLVSCTLGLMNIWTRQREIQLKNYLASAEEIKRLNRTYSTLSGVDQAIVHSRDPMEIVRSVCRIAVETGGFSLALYGELSEDGKKLNLIHQESNSQTNIPSSIVMKLRNEISGHNHADVIITGKSQFFNNIGTGLTDQEHEEDEFIHQFHSSAVFPLKRRGKVIGIFHLFSDEMNYITEMEMKLIDSISEDLSYAMDYIDEEQNLIEAKKSIDHLNSELEDRVIERTTHLESAVRELNAFSYSVSHDLRAPLRSISGYTEILRADYGASFTEDGLALIDKVQRNIYKMGQLIDDLLAFSQVSKSNLKKVMIDMTQMVQDTYDTIISAEHRKHIHFELSELPYASCDANYMSQVWQNLLENAVKFSSKVEEPRIVVRGEIRKNETLFMVQDNGIGFEPKYSEKIFGTFEKLNSESEFEGTGIGLALAKRIIQRHGGNIWAEGELFKGATFYFTLPN